MGWSNLDTDTEALEYLRKYVATKFGEVQTHKQR